jgi:hypothetical protein
MIVMKKIILLAYLLIFVMMPAHAEWVMVSSSKKGVTHYFDPDNIQINGQFRKVWVLSSYEQKQTGGYQATKSLYKLDCPNNQARSRTMLLYPDLYAEMSVIGAQHAQSAEWFNYTANSFLGRIARTVCKE